MDTIEPIQPELLKLADALIAALGLRLGEVVELLKLDEVARRLSTGVRTVETLVARGELESSIIPGTANSRRVSREQLDNFVRRFNIGT